ncbi:MAG: hypothetical protein ABW137_26760 [Mycobacterium sp.]
MTIVKRTRQLAAIMLLTCSAVSITSGSASAGPLTSVDDLLRVIAQRSDQLPRADLDDLLTRSRTVLVPVEQERGTVFGDVMDSACFMNDLVGDQGWDAANDWLDSQPLTIQDKATIRVQALKLGQSSTLSDYGPPVAELICEAV